MESAVRKRVAYYESFLGPDDERQVIDRVLELDDLREELCEEDDSDEGLRGDKMFNLNCEISNLLSRLI